MALSHYVSRYVGKGISTHNCFELFGAINIGYERCCGITETVKMLLSSHLEFRLRTISGVAYSYLLSFLKRSAGLVTPRDWADANALLRDVNTTVQFVRLLSPGTPWRCADSASPTSAFAAGFPERN
jgi:hypothetical protein